MEFPIRAKLLLLMAALVLGATASYLALAVKVFKDDKTSLIYELNASNVKTLAAEVDAQLGKIADKAKLLTQGHRDEAWTRAVLEAEPDIIRFALYEPPAAGGDPNDWRLASDLKNPEYLKLYGLKPEDAERVRQEVPVPFGKVLAKRVWVANATLAGGAPIMTLALSIDVRDAALSSAERVAVVDVRLDRLLKLLQGRGIATAYVVDSEGRVLGHPDGELVATRAPASDMPMVAEALGSTVAMQVKEFEYKGTRWLGAYATVASGGLAVISQVGESQAFRAARRLIEKSALFGLIVLTLSLLVSRWLSRGFTDPLGRLVAATEKLSRWEFTESVHVKSRDEIGRLARSFNAMASDLQAQRKQLEAHQEELELKVKERTSALETQKKQLAESQDALIRTTRLASLGELAGAAAHEVLNPINNMNIRVERLRKQMTGQEKEDAQLFSEIVGGWKETFAKGGWDALQAELSKPVEGGRKLIDEDLENLSGISAEMVARQGARYEDMEFIMREITRVTRIINNMRSLSRVGGERRPLDIHAPIDETAATLADLFEKRKVSLVKEFSADPRDRFQVIADKDELVQVFSNLVRNALHAIDSAHRRAGVIRVATRRAGDRVEVRITDNGTGIAAANLPRIFEPSFTTKSVEEGTGLGLSISRRLVRAFGGDIEVESTTEGDGTTFLLWFPVSNA